MTPLALIDAHSAAEAAALLREHGGAAQLLASGGDVLGLLKEGIDPAPPGEGRTRVLVNLLPATDLATLASDGRGGGLRIGAMVTLSRLQRSLQVPAVLREAAARIASPQLRARTTVGGNLLQRPRCWIFRHPQLSCFKKGGSGCPAAGGPAEADPGALAGAGPCHAAHPSDLATVLVALGAEADVAGAGSRRRVRLEALYGGAAQRRHAEADLAADEVLAAVLLPPPCDGERAAFEKVAPRSANEFAAASAAVLLRWQDERVAEARVVLGGVAPMPWVCEEAAAALRGRRAGEIAVEALAAASVPGGPRAGRHRYRAAAARLAVERALRRAIGAAA